MDQQAEALTEEITAITREPIQALRAVSRTFDISVRKSLRTETPRFWWDITEVAIDEDGAAADRYDWESDMLLYDTPEAALASAADMVARVATRESGHRPGFQA